MKSLLYQLLNMFASMIAKHLVELQKYETWKKQNKEFLRREHAICVAINKTYNAYDFYQDQKEV